MACDRFVYWKKKGKDRKDPPSWDQVRLFLEDYFGEVAKVEWDDTIKRFIVTFPGTTTNAFRRVWVTGHTQNHEPRERWIEVILDSDSVDVLTRMQDQMVGDMANNLQKWFAKFWEGEAEIDE